jgi:methylmalonyl-CoA mutase, C-terminal domain
LLKKQGGENVLLIGGGIIPERDKKLLEEKGIRGNFGPGTSLHEIIEYITSNT